MFRLIQTTESLITPAATQALTLEYVKTHLRSLNDADDALVRVWIDAAASYFTEKTGRPLITETRELWLEAFPNAFGSGWYYAGWPGHLHGLIELPHPPLVKVNSVQYLDATGAYVEFSDGASPETLYWQYGAPQGPYARRGWVRPIVTQSWPCAQPDPAAVKINYDCGYGGIEDVPELARGILCYMIASYDQNRSPEAFRSAFADFPLGMQAIMDGFKSTALPSHVLHHPSPWGPYGAGIGGYPWL